MPHGAAVVPPQGAECLPGCWIKTARVWAVPGIVVCNCMASGAIGGAGSTAGCCKMQFSKFCSLGRKHRTTRRTNYLFAQREGGGITLTKESTRCGLTHLLHVAVPAGAWLFTGPLCRRCHVHEFTTATRTHGHGVDAGCGRHCHQKTRLQRRAVSSAGCSAAGQCKTTLPHGWVQCSAVLPACLPMQKNLPHWGAAH